MLYLGIDQHAKQLTVSLRSQTGDVIFNRQVSTQPERFHEFFNDLKQKAADEGYIAILEVCGFNDWLLAALPNYGARDVVLIQPTKKPKVKDRSSRRSLAQRAAVG